MDIEKIATLLQNLNPVTIRPSLCSKMITPKSSCSNCLNNCPVQGIKLTGNGPKVDQCISCGLCIEACPNHVFKLNENQLLEIDNKENQILILTCSLIHQNIERRFQNCVTKISCLGELYPELTLYLLSSFSKVILIQDPNQCKNCLSQNIEEKLRFEEFSDLSNNFANKLLIVNEINEIKPYLDTQKLQPSNDRRSFFKSIFAGSKNMSKQILDSALYQENSKSTKEKVKPLKKYYLKESLKKEKALDQSKVLPYSKLTLTACNFCEACSKLCPTAALKITEIENGKKITFTPNLCTHCNICRDVCFYQGISWGEKVTIKEFLNDEPQVLAIATKKTCKNCQQDYYDLNEKENLCFLCRPIQNIIF